MRTLVRRAISMSLLCLFICPAAHAATAEYQLEAVFLFNFTQFVEWPAGAFARNDSPLLICVLGEDPFGTYLDDIVRGESVRGHPLAIERHQHAEDVQHCHILFFGHSETDNFRLALQKLKDTSVLTVGNFEGFAYAGGIIRFHIADNKLRLRINVSAAQAARLTVSSKLLKQAELIGYGED